LNLPAPWTVLFGSQPLAFPLPGSTADAVARLRGIIHTSFLPSVPTSNLVGEVSEDQVRVRFRRASMAPVFVGHFTVIAGRRTLAGVVRLTRFAQAWLAVWFGILLVLTTITVPAALLKFTEPGSVFSLLILLMMWAGGLGVLYFGWWLGRDHRAEIEKRLRQALSSVAA